MRMAWTQERAGRFRVLFRFQGKQYAFNLGQVAPDEAAKKASHVDYLLMRLKEGLVELPPEMDIVSFVEHDGQEPLAVKAATRRVTASLGTLRDQFVATHSGTHEAKTLDTTKIHFKHLGATLGETFPLAELTHATLQRHIERRAAAGIKPVTIKKELSSLRT